jgi:hypothetical protein
VTIPLNGSGQAISGLNVNPPQLTFAATVVGQSSAAQTVTVSNTGSVQASQLAIAVTPGFALTQNACAASLAAGASCTVAVTFEPSATGPAAGTMSATSASFAAAATVELNGTGAVASGLLVTPATITFASTGVGQASSATTITLTNTGAAAALNNLALAVPAGFQLVNNTCAASLGPGMSCTAGVEFAPIAAGALTGNLMVSTSSLASGAAVALQGMGFDFTVTISGANAQSVAAGLTANYTLVLTPLGGSSGTFSFACDSLPTNAACGFSPATETVTGGITGSLAVGVSTGGSTAAVRKMRHGAWGLLPLVCGLLLIPLGSKRRRKAGFLLVLVGIFIGGVASCTASGGGTGGGGGGGSGTTPTGTYSVPVTVTSTGVSHSASVTLTVD